MASAREESGNSRKRQPKGKKGKKNTNVGFFGLKNPWVWGVLHCGAQIHRRGGETKSLPRYTSEMCKAGEEGIGEGERHNWGLTGVNLKNINEGGVNPPSGEAT